MSRRARSQPARTPQVTGCPHANGYRNKRGDCVDCGAIASYYLLAPALQQLVEAARNLEVRRVPELDEAPPERETFSGGVYPGARERNIARLKYTVIPSQRLVLVGKYTLQLMKQHLTLVPDERANERHDVRARMQALGLSTEGLR